MKVSLRPYQQEGHDTVFEKYESGVTKQLVVMATGLGKTRLGAAIIQTAQERLPNCKCLWLTHTEELIEQSAMAIMNNLFPEHEESFGNIPKIGVLQFCSKNADIFTNHIAAYSDFRDTLGIVKQELMQIDKPLVVASIQTLQRRLEKMSPDEFDLIIVDEADLAAAPTWQKCLDYFNHSLRIGLTATPERLDGASLSHLFDEIVFDRDIKFGIDNNFLCEIDAIKVKTTLSLDSVRTTGGELNQKDLRIVDCPERNIQIVNKYIEHTNGIPTIAFCVDMEHAKNLCEHFTRQDIRSAFVVSDTTMCPNRKELIQQFKNGEIDVLTNVDILTAGFDYPNVGCIINAAPTKSKRKFLQRIGRGTRLKTDSFVERFGQKLLILDITDDTRKHALVNAWSLNKDKPLEDRVFISKEKKAEMFAKIKLNRKIEHTQEIDEKVNLLKLPVLTWNPYSKAHHEDATQPQLALLERKGYDVTNTTWTKMDAMQMISSFGASDAQVNMIAKLGFDTVGLTIGQVSKIMEKHKKEKEARLNAFVIEKNERNVKTPFSGIR